MKNHLMILKSGQKLYALQKSTFQKVPKGTLSNAKIKDSYMA